MSATALNALLVVQVLVPNEATATDYANFAVDWGRRKGISIRITLHIGLSVFLENDSSAKLLNEGRKIIITFVGFVLIRSDQFWIAGKNSYSIEL